MSCNENMRWTFLSLRHTKFLCGFQLNYSQILKCLVSRVRPKLSQSLWWTESHFDLSRNKVRFFPTDVKRCSDTLSILYHAKLAGFCFLYFPNSTKEPCGTSYLHLETILRVVPEEAGASWMVTEFHKINDLKCQQLPTWKIIRSVLDLYLKKWPF